MNVSHLAKGSLLLLALTALNANAHRAWILPNQTTVSGDEAVVSFDAAVSNEIFTADHSALRTNAFLVTAPDGSSANAKDVHSGKTRTSFDLILSEEGTYRVSVASAGLMARWETEDGKRGFWPERGKPAKDSEFDKAVPKNAKNLQVSYNARRMETFVTNGTPSTGALALTNQGLELVPVTHPNDLFAGEVARFRFVMDGKPAAGVDVALVREGTRYRNSQEEIELKTDANGEVAIQWNGAGRYFLEASYKDDKAKAPATSRSASYTAVLEVMPD
ncbi:DUF4198 domain-containing protein [Thalassolituus sp. LLYu03]|uniref:DUF4198 domain-containing protein n=1 Tax=Thalassolituus sp. LLYu03 TaxID=3421656 RepID=UPI003D2D4AB8